MREEAQSGQRLPGHPVVRQIFQQCSFVCILRELKERTRRDLKQQNVKESGFLHSPFQRHLDISQCTQKPLEYRLYFPELISRYEYVRFHWDCVRFDFLTALSTDFLGFLLFARWVSVSDEILMNPFSQYPEDGGSKALRDLTPIYEIACRYIKEDCNIHSITLLKI